MAKLTKCSNPLQFRHKHNNKICKISPKCLSLCKENFPGPNWHPDLKLCSLCRLKVSNLAKAKNNVPDKWQPKSKLGKEDAFMPIIVRVEKLMVATGDAPMEKTFAGEDEKDCSMQGVTDGKSEIIRDMMMTSTSYCGYSDDGLEVASKLDTSFPAEGSNNNGISPNKVIRTNLREIMEMESGILGILKTSGSKRKSNKRGVRFSDVEAEFLIFSKDDEGKHTPLIMPRPPIRTVEFEQSHLCSSQSDHMSSNNGPLFFEEDLEGIDGDEDEENFMFKIMGLPCLNMLTEYSNKSAKELSETSSKNKLWSEYEKSLEAFMINDNDDACMK